MDSGLPLDLQTYILQSAFQVKCGVTLCHSFVTSPTYAMCSALFFSTVWLPKWYWYRIQIMKFLTMHFFPASCYSVSALNILLTAFQIPSVLCSLYGVIVSHCYWKFFSFNSSFLLISEQQASHCNWAEQYPYAVADPPVLCLDHGRSNVLYHWFGVLLFAGNACCVVAAVSVEWCWTQVQNI